MSANLYDLFASRFPDDRDQLFLELPSGGGYSYRALEQATARLAGLLLELGLRRGDRVAVQVEKSPEALLLYLATLRAGLVFLPLNPAYPAAELEHLLGDAQPRLFVCAPAAEAGSGAVARAAGVARVLTLGTAREGTLLEEGSRSSAERSTAATTHDDMAALLYTSGTTGRPKGAVLTHRNLAANARVLHALWGFGPDDVLLHALPLFHVHGLFVASHCVLMAGARILFLERFEPARVVELLPRATVFMGVPTLYTRLLAEAGLGSGACRRMRLFVCGSAPLRPETVHAFHVRTGHRLLERYGMTETGMLTSQPLEGDRLPGTVGRPLPGVSLRIVGENGAVLPSGAIGHVEVKGENVFSGYFRRPAPSPEDFTPDGYFKTGDLGSLDEGGVLTLAGRSKEVVITGGYNVYPKEVERCLDAVPGVAESAVFGLPHPDYGEAVTAAVVPAPGAALTEAEVLRALRGQLAGYKLPKRIMLLPQLPRNSMGKVQKHELRRWMETGAAPTT